MKIAVGSDDQKTIRKGHFGDSRYFLIFETNDGQIAGREVIENPHSDEDGDDKVHHHGKAASIWNTLRGVEVFIGRSMGRQSVAKLVEKGVTPLLTKIEDVEEAVQAFLQNQMESFYHFDTEEKKFKPTASKK
jgi:predicted Fe-Mo cluster-binding NifX family protein